MSRSLSDLVDDGQLISIRIGLLPGEVPYRRLYACPEFLEWVLGLSTAQRADALKSERNEINSIVSSFIAGKKLGGDITRVYPPAGEGLFKLKTTSFRLYGWCPEAQTLVLVLGVRKIDIINRNAPSDKENGRIVVARRKELEAERPLNGEWHELFRARD